jgi:hypothetical protein
VLGTVGHAYYPALLAAARPGWIPHFGTLSALGARVITGAIIGAMVLPLVLDYVSDAAGMRFLFAGAVGWSIRGLISPALACTCGSPP